MQPPARVRRRFTETGDGKRHRTSVVHRIEHATVYEINDGVYSAVVTNDRLGLVEPLQPPTKTRKATAATGNGMRLGNKTKPGMRINVVEALRRNEQLGRSWRGSQEGS